MTKREKDMILFAYELFIDMLVEIEDNKISVKEAIEKVNSAYDKMKDFETRNDYDE